MRNKKIFLSFNPEKKDDLSIKKWIDFFENSKDFIVEKDAEKADIIVPIWWDATILYSIFFYKNLEKPFFPIAWWTKNFLLNKVRENDELFWEIESFKFWFISCKATFKDWTTQVFEAFNDIYLNAKIWWIWYLEIKWENYPKREVIWDGIIVSTPQWSTWYNKNAWWVILPLERDLLSITDINSTKKISHIISVQELEIDLKRWDFKLSFDMKTFDKIVEKLNIDKSKKEVEILFLKNKNFEKFRYIDKN